MMSVLLPAAIVALSALVAWLPFEIAHTLRFWGKRTDTAPMQSTAF